MTGPKVDNYRLDAFRPAATKVGIAPNEEWVQHVLLVDAAGDPLVTIPIGGTVTADAGAGFAQAVRDDDDINSSTDLLLVAVKNGSGKAKPLAQPTTPADTQPVSGAFYPTEPTTLSQSKVSVTTSQVLLAANASRKGGFIQMVTAAGVCHINHGGAATTSHGFIMNKGHVYEIPRGLVGAVYGIAASGTVEVIAAEYT